MQGHDREEKRTKILHNNSKLSHSGGQNNSSCYAVSEAQEQERLLNQPRVPQLPFTLDLYLSITVQCFSGYVLTPIESPEVPDARKTATGEKLLERLRDCDLPRIRCNWFSLSTALGARSITSIKNDETTLN